MAEARGEVGQEPPGAPAWELEELHKELNTTDLAVEVLDKPDPVEPGDTLVYTVSVTNRGPNPSTSTLLVVEMPPGAVSRLDRTCVLQDRSLSCELGELTAREKRTISVAVVVQLQTETMTLTAKVSNRLGPDFRPDDNTTSETTRVRRAQGDGT